MAAEPGTLEGLAVSGFWRDRPTFVTGATGLVGGWLVRRLVDAGADVTCLVRDWVPESQLVRGGLWDRVHVVRGDVTDQRLLSQLAKEAAAAGKPLPFHLKVDTGMGRLGLAPSEWAAFLDTFPRWKSLHLEGCMTHLADSDGNDSSHTEQQLKTFRGLLEQLEQRGIKPTYVHVANSAAIMRYSQAHFSLVRPGIMLYGYHTLPRSIPCPSLQPVLSLHTTVMQLRTIKPGETVSYNRTFVAKRPSTVAVLPIGYADGYSRQLSNKGFVLVRGKRAPIVGLICMDMTMVDVTDIPGVQVGDQVTVIGRQGEEAIQADELAEQSGTIPYETLCGIGPRIPRVYK